jgi:cell division protein FtsI/penicillin-binding protein 2
VLVLGAAALGTGIVLGSGSSHAERDTAARFARLWARDDYRGMYALIDQRARRSISESAFEAAYRAAATTATAVSQRVGEADDAKDHVVTVPTVVRTRVFGTVRKPLAIPLTKDGEETRVAWTSALVFPGLRRGESLTRETTMPPRGTLLARNGQVLASGSDRHSDIPDVSSQIVGSLERIPAEQLPAMRAFGYPDDAMIGASGLERVFQQQLAGTPGGRLLAGSRVLAATQPRAASEPVTTTIDPAIERTAAAQMGSHYGGIAAIEPSTGQILALAGVAFSGLQPPGSTFKIITATGALEHGIARLDSHYPVETEAVLDGVSLQNANGESCGGSLIESFADSCNSVFGPLGARLGASALLDVAQRYGFNTPLGIPGAATSTLPPASLTDDLSLGSTAIGQGEVQASALQMAIVAATIANGGKRPIPTLQLGTTPRFVPVTNKRVAHAVSQMMDAVVKNGTGTAAQISGVEVAGKTGTAELRSTVPPDDGDDSSDDGGDSDTSDDVPDTDAWFVGYAPEQKPKVTVGVMFSEAGAGGDVAAPAAREVLVTGLQQPLNQQPRANGSAAGASAASEDANAAG